MELKTRKVLVYTSLKKRGTGFKTHAVRTAKPAKLIRILPHQDDNESMAGRGLKE